MKLIESIVVLLAMGLCIFVFGAYAGTAILVLLLLAAIQQVFFRKPSIGPRKRSTYVPSVTPEPVTPVVVPVDPPVDTTPTFQHMKRQYLQSPKWNKKRLAVLQRDQYTCQSCGITNVPLHVHHMSGYELIPNEPTTCLISLCEDCHTAEHVKHGYPSTQHEYFTYDHPVGPTMLINLTGHEIHELETDIIIPPSKHQLRTSCVTTELAPINGIRTYRSEEHVLNSKLPKPVVGVVYIISALAMNAIPADRTDFVCPKQVVRENGKIIGCKGFRVR